MRGFSFFLQTRGDEIMNEVLPVYVHRHGTHAYDQMMCLISLFLARFKFLTKCNSSHLETLIRFCMGMFKFSEFGLERATTTEVTIIVYISLDFLL